MSNMRYDWWPYVKGMIRRYPLLADEYNDLKGQSISPKFSQAKCQGSGSKRTVESIALREFPPTKQREYEAVNKAITVTKSYRNGSEILKLINLVYWDKTHTLMGAAADIPCAEATAKRYNGEFIRLVASNFGLMDN